MDEVAGMIEDLANQVEEANAKADAAQERADEAMTHAIEVEAAQAALTMTGKSEGTGGVIVNVEGRMITISNPQGVDEIIEVPFEVEPIYFDGVAMIDDADDTNHNGIDVMVNSIVPQTQRLLLHAASAFSDGVAHITVPASLIFAVINPTPGLTGRVIVKGITEDFDVTTVHRTTAPTVSAEFGGGNILKVTGTMGCTIEDFLPLSSNTHGSFDVPVAAGTYYGVELTVEKGSDTIYSTWTQTNQLYLTTWSWIEPTGV